MMKIRVLAANCSSFCWRLDCCSASCKICVEDVRMKVQSQKCLGTAAKQFVDLWCPVVPNSTQHLQPPLNLRFAKHLALNKIHITG